VVIQTVVLTPLRPLKSEPVSENEVLDRTRTLSWLPTGTQSKIYRAGEDNSHLPERPMLVVSLSPCSKDVSTESEEPPLLATLMQRRVVCTATKQRLAETH
jgi:hypothetical protein